MVHVRFALNCLNTSSRFSPSDVGQLGGYHDFPSIITNRYRCVVRASAVPKLYVLCVWEVVPDCIGNV